MDIKCHDYFHISICFNWLSKIENNHARECSWRGGIWGGHESRFIYIFKRYTSVKQLSNAEYLARVQKERGIFFPIMWQRPWQAQLVYCLANAIIHDTPCTIMLLYFCRGCKQLKFRASSRTSLIRFHQWSREIYKWIDQTDIIKFSNYQLGKFVGSPQLSI